MVAAPRDNAAAVIAAYFHEFLPEAIGRSGLAGMTALDTKFRFMVEDVDRGSWICTFYRGALTQVLRSSCEDGVDFTYRMGAAAFMDIVCARVDPQGVFLEERAQISGNFESALKMGMILQQFTQECPYQPDPMQQRIQGALA
ncbi:MAG: SCP2 sterol-binding domain-containing protein [Planctomycetota bacterium]|nr:SCP2 sterol-binding domain-containing protein [Planctomycetota bacterium]